MQPDSNASFLIPLEDAFVKAGQELYLVGGFVRNRILGLPVSDIDLCGTATPDEAISLAQRAGYKASLRSCELGTVDLIGDQRAEYTPFRVESYAAGGSHRPVQVSFTRDICLDARRRDFTVNALYQRICTGEIVDPLFGMEDLKQKHLRACGVCAADTLADDGLRILRMVRFCAELGFLPDDDLLLASQAYAKNLKALSPSRIYGEWQRICLSDTKYPFVARDDTPYLAIDLLHRSGALFVLMPALYDCMGIPQNPNYHLHDVFFHSLHSFASVEADVALRTAALLHDIGKPPCFLHQDGRMHGHQIAGLQLADPILNVLGMPNNLRKEILLLIERHMFDLNGKANPSTVRIRFANWGFEFARKLIALRKGDVLGSGVGTKDTTAQRWEEILQTMIQEGAFDDPRRLAIDGDDIAEACQLKPGKRIGRIKQILFNRCAVSPKMNRRDVLLKEATRVNRQLPASEN